jgi:MFS family permease
LIAILVLHAGPAAVSALAAVSLGVGAVVALPLGPWVELRRKRRVMIGMDLVRFAALLTVPLAYALGTLTFAQLLLVSVVVGAADIAFKAASGAFLKSLVPREGLLLASARLESTMWTATALGPPVGGAAIGVLGPVTTVIANAVSFLVSALGLRAIGSGELRPERRAERARFGDLLEGWRFIFADRTLRGLFFNTVLVNALLLATAPLLAVLMLGQLGFPPWEYGLAFAVPCLGGLVGSRMSRRLVARFGRRRVLLLSGALRACFPLWLAFIGPGVRGLALVMATEGALIVSIGVFNPVYAAFRLERTGHERVARVLSAWSISSNATTAVLTALGGALAAATSPRAALAVAGTLLLATPLLLPRKSAKNALE